MVSSVAGAHKCGKVYKGSASILSNWIITAGSQASVAVDWITNEMMLLSKLTVSTLNDIRHFFGRDYRLQICTALVCIIARSRATNITVALHNQRKAPSKFDLSTTRLEPGMLPWLAYTRVYIHWPHVFIRQQYTFVGSLVLHRVGLSSAFHCAGP